MVSAHTWYTHKNYISIWEINQIIWHK